MQGILAQLPVILKLCVSVLIFAIVLVPAWVELLGRQFAIETDVTPMLVAAVIGKAFLLPLVAGMIVGRLLPGVADGLSDRLFAVAGTLMVLCALALLAAHWEVLLQLKRPGMLALVALMVVALAIGHALGGPDPDDRTALAVACATRHVGLAVLVASAFPGIRTMAVIAAYAIASLLVSIPYLAWRRRRTATA